MTPRIPIPATGPDDERGSVSIFVIGIVVVLMAVAGLVVDGGRAVNARAQIMDDAEQSARAGANQIDDAAMRSGEPIVLDQDAAAQAAADYLAARGYDPSRVAASADATSISVSVTDTVPTALLSLVFIKSFEVEGTAVAHPAVGVSTEITGAP